MILSSVTILLYLLYVLVMYPSWGSKAYQQAEEEDEEEPETESWTWK